MTRRYRCAWMHWHHPRTIGRHLHIHYIYELDIEDQIGLRGNSRMRRIRPRPAVRPVRQLPRDKQPPLATYLHPFKSLIESRNHAPESLHKRKRLRIAENRFAVGSQFRLAILAHHRWPMIGRGIE